MLSYHVVIDPTMVVNALQTDRHEATALFSPRMLLIVGLLGGLPALAVWRTPVAWGAWTARAWRNLLWVAAALAVLLAVALASFAPLSSTMRNHKQVRYLMNPLATLYAAGWLAAAPLRRDESRLGPHRPGRHAGHRAGQQAAAGGAGAGRDPAAQRQFRPERVCTRHHAPAGARENAVSFRNAWSCGTSTAASVPCMFSHLGRDAFEGRTHNYESLMDVIQRAGLAVLWAGQPVGLQGRVRPRVPQVATSSLAHPGLCPGGECLDGVMLDGLDARISALDPGAPRARAWWW
jgi:lipid A ethanolaminephosphotransferase